MKSALSAQKAFQGSETRELQGGTEEKGLPWCEVIDFALQKNEWFFLPICPLRFDCLVLPDDAGLE